MCKTRNISIFANKTANTPDLIVIDETNREVFLMEVGCTFDSRLEEAFLTKQVKYQPLVQVITHIGCSYICQPRPHPQAGGQGSKNYGAV